MKPALSLSALLALAACSSLDPEPPIPSGQYEFLHRFVEHPTIPSVKLVAVIKGRSVVLANHSLSSALPLGVVARGQLMWHSKSRSWVIGQKPEDGSAPEVGGCTGGPEVIDLQARVYWSC
jgi:hypothetical protein